MDPIVINVNFALDSCSLYSCYRKMVFTLLISKSHGLLHNKKLISNDLILGSSSNIV